MAQVDAIFFGNNYDTTPGAAVSPSAAAAAPPGRYHLPSA
jgi:hypothetical protein